MRRCRDAFGAAETYRDVDIRRLTITTCNCANYELDVAIKWEHLASCQCMRDRRANAGRSLDEKARPADLAAGGTVESPTRSRSQAPTQCDSPITLAGPNSASPPTQLARQLRAPGPRRQFLAIRCARLRTPAGASAQLETPFHLPVEPRLGDRTRCTSRKRTSAAANALKRGHGPYGGVSGPDRAPQAAATARCGCPSPLTGQR